MRPDDAVRLRHMLDAAGEAIAAAADRQRSDLESDYRFALVVERLLQIIGEAAWQLSDETRDAIAGVPWPQIIGMRHRLVHAYYDVDLDIIWGTVREDLPRLIAALEPKVNQSDA